MGYRSYVKCILEGIPWNMPLATCIFSILYINDAWHIPWYPTRKWGIISIYYTILYYTILYYTILYYTILYYTVVYYKHFVAPMKQDEIHFLFKCHCPRKPGRNKRSSSTNSLLLFTVWKLSEKIRNGDIYNLWQLFAPEIWRPSSFGGLWP